MLALLQRVSQAQVDVRGERIAAIGRGLLVFYCAERDDEAADCERLLGRVLRMRCFPDESGRMNRSLVDIDGELLVVPQFTLAADTSSGNRPGFSAAAAPDEGERLFERFVALAREASARVQAGRFGADMQVSLVNDGPVTLWLRTGARSGGARTTNSTLA
ncbi:MAG: D-tyrosyl-tRNA(Tyr) deacylase [Burkholderiaceae bacterium]|nr:D-tyrosyl-tRNA(Tyr) deacylase [Burkholderiaceae bacterium]